MLEGHSRLSVVTVEDKPFTLCLHGFLRILIVINYAKPMYIPVSHWYPARWPTECTGGSASRQGQAVQWEEQTWLPLVGPKLEIWTEMREAVSY